LAETEKDLWGLFLGSSLSKYGIGGNRFKNPNMWALLNEIDGMLGDARDKIVFDVGCGTGIKSILMGMKGAKVRGFDVDSRAIENCRKNLKKVNAPLDVEFILQDAQNNFPAKYDGKVDFILCNQVIEHIPDYKKALEKMIKALKPGGRILITTPNKLTHMPRKGEKVFGEKELGHHHSFSRDALREVLKDNKNVVIEELTTHQSLPPFPVRAWYKLLSKLNELQWFLQKTDEKRATGFEKTYVALIAPLVALHNFLIYPCLLKWYLTSERKVDEDQGLTIHLILRKL